MTKFKEKWQKVPKWLRIVTYSVLGALGIAVIGALFGFLIRWLWNWLMPELFGLKAITYWQGVGLFILAKILFGGISESSESKRHKGKKERRCGQHQGAERGTDFNGMDYYEDWWEKEGRTAFDHFANGRYASEKADETGPEKEEQG